MQAYRRNIIYDYIQTFTRNFNLVHIIWMIYLKANGFTLFELGIVEGIFHITSLTMEIPTGIIADVFGRKVSRLLSVLFYIAYLVLLVMHNNLFVVSLAFVFCGLSYTLESGAGDALVYDSLVELGEEDRYVKVNSKKEVLFQIASTVSALIAGYIAKTNIELVFKITIIVFVITFIVILRMKETTVDKVKSDLSIKEKFRKQYIESFKYIIKSKRLIFLILIISLFTFPITVIFFYSSNYFIELGFNEFHVGVFFSLHSLSAIIGAISIEKIRNKFNEKIILILFPALEVLMLWGMLSSKPFIAFIVLGALDSIIYVIILDYINKLIPSDKRATILSMTGMVFSLLMIFIFPLFGLVSDNLTMSHGFILNAAFISLCFVIYLVNYRRFIDA